MLQNVLLIYVQHISGQETKVHLDENFFWYVQLSYGDNYPQRFSVVVSERIKYKVVLYFRWLYCLEIYFLCVSCDIFRSHEILALSLKMAVNKQLCVSVKYLYRFAPNVQIMKLCNLVDISQQNDGAANTLKEGQKHCKLF